MNTVYSEDGANMWRAEGVVSLFMMGPSHAAGQQLSPESTEWFIGHCGNGTFTKYQLVQRPTQFPVNWALVTEAYDDPPPPQLMERVILSACLGMGVDIEVTARALGRVTVPQLANISDHLVPKKFMARAAQQIWTTIIPSWAPRVNDLRQWSEPIYALMMIALRERSRGTLFPLLANFPLGGPVNEQEGGRLYRYGEEEAIIRWL